MALDTVFYAEDLAQNLFFLGMMFAFSFSGLICISPGITITGSKSVLCTDGKLPSHTGEEKLVFLHEFSNPSEYHQDIIVVVYLFSSFLL